MINQFLGTLLAFFQPLCGLQWKHKKRESLYLSVGEAGVQASQPIKEGDRVVVYIGMNGQLWVRPVAEFLDGRFEQK